MAPVRPLIDWHTHCYLPEHTGAESQATMRARGVIGGEACRTSIAAVWPRAVPRSSW